VSIESEVKILRSIPLFAKLDPSKLKLLAFTSEWQTFFNGEYLCQQDEMGDSAFIIIEGEADVLVKSGQKELSLGVRKRGEVLGEIAILCDVPRTASVRAVGRLVTLKISKDVFLQLVSGYPEVALEVVRTLALRLAATTQKLRSVRGEP
jgi:CRP-like cAMP-binding protein